MDWIFQLYQAQAITESVVACFQYNPSKPLLFNSGLFLLFFTVFYGLYLTVHRQRFLKMTFVVAASLFFYYKCSGQFFWILIASTIFDFIIGQEIGKAKSKGGKKGLLILSIVGNLCLLGYFKYTNFFIDVLNDGLHQKFGFTNILLPVGISFYTFQTISYSVDVYRERLKPCKNLLDFAFFVTFFPQLVAGPIVRAADFIPQIKTPFNLTKANRGKAFWLIISGLFKKAIISDYISINFVDRVFESPLRYSSFENLMATYGYAVQIYCDFSGYSDMAIGLALLLGFSIPDNFLKPYQSASITEFWQRWHISLSSWLKDYLYIPLGGNQKGRIRTGLHLLITMLLGGFWHGANWKFVLWGGIHGIILVLERLTGWSNWTKKYWLLRLIGIIITFHVVCACWILFRAESYGIALQVVQQIFGGYSIAMIQTVVLGYWKVFALIGLAFCLHAMPMRFEQVIKTQYAKWPAVIQSMSLAIMFWLVYQFANSALQPFIYFQF